jgi:hypothetical protein
VGIIPLMLLAILVASEYPQIAAETEPSSRPRAYPGGKSVLSPTPPPIIGNNRKIAQLKTSPFPGAHPLFQPGVRERSMADGSGEPLKKKITAEGVGTVYGGDYTQARLMALRAAYAEAVSRVCGVEIGSLSVIRNVRNVSEVIMSRSRGFISSYSILKEGVSPRFPNRYEVIIEALVVDQGLAGGGELEGLRLYLEMLGTPRMLIMLPEQSWAADKVGNPDPSPSNNSPEKVQSFKDRQKKSVFHPESKPREDEPGLRSAEAALAQAFSKYGYQVMTTDDLLEKGLVDPETLKQAKMGATAEALKVARAAQVDIALIGLLRLSQRKLLVKEVTLSLVSAEASAKALIVSSGRLVQAVHHLERSSAVDALVAYADCLDRVSQGMADILAWKIPIILTEHGRDTSIIIHGVSSDETFKIQRQLLTELSAESIRINKVPADLSLPAELVLTTGFVGIHPERIKDICSQVLKTPVVVSKLDRFTIELRTERTQKNLTSKPKKRGPP